jgi:DNA replication protein DnaC
MNEYTATFIEKGSMQDNIKSYCKLLSIPIVASSYESIAMAATKAKMSYQEYLYKVLQEQVIARIDNSVNARIKKARFPFLKTLEEFDFSYQPQLDEKLIRELANLNFLKTAHNILFIGPPGVGKTHLAVAFGLKAAYARKRTLFFTAEEIINELIAAEVSKQLLQFLDVISRVDLIIIDELGYLQISPKAASLFFRLITKRYEKGSVIVTSNRPFEEWGDIFNDDVVAAAILDRLLHHSHPFLIQGKSYRMKEIFSGKNIEKKERIE